MVRESACLGGQKFLFCFVARAARYNSLSCFLLLPYKQGTSTIIWFQFCRITEFCQRFKSKQTQLDGYTGWRPEGPIKYQGLEITYDDRGRQNMRAKQWAHRSRSDAVATWRSGAAGPACRVPRPTIHLNPKTSGHGAMELRQQGLQNHMQKRKRKIFPSSIFINHKRKLGKPGYSFGVLLSYLAISFHRSTWRRRMWLLTILDDKEVVETAGWICIQFYCILLDQIPWTFFKGFMDV